MRKIEINDNQTLLDVAMEYHGCAEAIGELLLNNPQIKNDIKALIDAKRTTNEFHPDVKLALGSILFIDDNSRAVKKNVVKKINRSVNTYMTEQWQERLNK